MVSKQLDDQFNKYFHFIVSRLEAVIFESYAETFPLKSKPSLIQWDTLLNDGKRKGLEKGFVDINQDREYTVTTSWPKDLVCLFKEAIEGGFSANLQIVHERMNVDLMCDEGKRFDLVCQIIFHTSEDFVVKWIIPSMESDFFPTEDLNSNLNSCPIVSQLLDQGENDWLPTPPPPPPVPSAPPPPVPPLQETKKYHSYDQKLLSNLEGATQILIKTSPVGSEAIKKGEVEAAESLIETIETGLKNDSKTVVSKKSAVTVLQEKKKRGRPKKETVDLTMDDIQYDYDPESHGFQVMGALDEVVLPEIAGFIALQPECSELMERTMANIIYSLSVVDQVRIYLQEMKQGFLSSIIWAGDKTVAFARCNFCPLHCNKLIDENTHKRIKAAAKRARDKMNKERTQQGRVQKPKTGRGKPGRTPKLPIIAEKNVKQELEREAAAAAETTFTG